MKPRLSLVELVGMFAVGMTVALLCRLPCACAQAPQALEKQQAEIDPLLKEVLAVTQSGGDEGLRAWTKANKDRVAADWIVRLAERGVKERDGSRIKLALVLAAEKGDQACLASVYSRAADYYSALSDYTAAMKFYELALPLYGDIGDLSGQGNVYKSEGNLFSRTGDQAKAQECYNHALPIFRAAGDRSGEARTLNNIGNVYGDLGDQAKALDYYQQAVSIERAIGLREVEAMTLTNIGRVYADLGDQAKALDYYQQALPIERALGDRAGEAGTLAHTGDIYFRLGEQAKALEYYQQAVQVFRAVGNRAAEARMLADMGEVYLGVGETQKALESYQQALPIFRAVSNRVGEAATLNGIGLVCFRLGDTQNALEYFEQALPIERAMGNRADEAGALANIGSVYFRLGEPAKALEYLEQALPIERAVGDRAGEAKTLNNIGQLRFALGEPAKALEYFEQALPIERAMGNRADEAGTLANIGAVYWVLGEQAKALGYYQQALPIERAVGDRAGEATTLHHIGAVYYALGEKGKALEYLEQALSIEQAVRNRAGEAAMLNDIGFLYYDLGKRAKALEYYNQALPIERAVGYRAGEAGTLDSIGVVYSALGKRVKALKYLEQALAIERAVGYRAGEAETLNNIGEVYAALGKQTKALAYYQQALPIERSVGNRAGEAETLKNLMALHDRQGHRRLAIFFGKRSVNLYQELRAAIQTLEKETQRTYLKTVEGTYRELADILAAAGRLGEAQQVLGLLKEEEYFEFVRRDAATAKQLQGRADLTSTEKSALVRYEEVADKVTALGGRVEELRVMPHRTAEQEAELAKLKDDLTAASKAFQVVLRQIEDEMGQTPEARDVVRELAATRGLGVDLKSLGEAVAVISTVVTDKAVWVILTTPTTQVAGKSKILIADLNRKVLAFRETLQDPRVDPRPLARELYSILIGPVEKDLAGAAPKTLAWSLDGTLRYLPVAALYDGKRYLVERYATAVLTLAGRSRLALEPTAAWRALGVGVSQPHEGFRGLPSVPAELQAVIHEETTQPTGQGVLPGHVLLNEAFTRQALDAGLQQGYPVVHVASHFAFQPGNATDSFLLLGDGSHLTLEDMRSSGLPMFGGVELLTLSACDTAMGGERADGREVEGFGVEAQNQGARAVIATLWPVADESTAELVADFYRRRQEKGLSKAEALREAQLALLQGRAAATTPGESPRGLSNPKTAGGGQTQASAPRFPVDPAKPYAHPYYWAPFILMGNWR